MTIATARPLGTMVAYGFADRDLSSDLAIARGLGAAVLEIFPDWRNFPDAGNLRVQVESEGMTVHSAHGCWGGQSIRADRVDLSHLEPSLQNAAIDDLKRCVDWLGDAGGCCLVVHPGGLSPPEQTAARRAALGRGLLDLADHARGTGVVLCVENMPPGVHPGSRMASLFDLVAELGRSELALALDTGHAHISAEIAAETRAAGRLLRTTHVHDNDGRHDAHWPPGVGTVDWSSWRASLDQIEYTGPIMLECIRHFRKHPESVNAELRELLKNLISP